MNLTELQEKANAGYKEFRGRCKELSEKACAEDSSLTLVKGFYFCPLWCTNEHHWWTKKPDGTIYDPLRLQFPSAGYGIYEEFDGYIDCDDCGETVKEENAIITGRYAFCCNKCAFHFVGL